MNFRNGRIQRLCILITLQLLIFAMCSTFALAQEVTFGGTGSPWVIRNLIQDKINQNGLPYGNIGPHGLLRSTGGSGGGNRWNDNGVENTATLNRVCQILGFGRYVRSTCLDEERSGRYPFGKCNYHSPSDNELTYYDPNTDTFKWRSAKPKYGNTWIASITCADPLDPCSDGIDNDGDGLTDWDDPICESTNGEREAAECQDGIDNDDDGFIDYAGYCAPENRCAQETISTNGRADVVLRYTVPCDGFIRAQPREEETLISVWKIDTGKDQYLVLCDEDFIEDRCEGQRQKCCGKDDEDVDDHGALVCSRDNTFLGAPSEERGKECPTDGTALIPIPVKKGDKLSLGQWENGGASSFTFYPDTECSNPTVPADPDCDGPNDDDESTPPVADCFPGQEETRDCWTDGVGICELGWQGRWCTSTLTWSDWSTCRAEFTPGERTEDCSNDLDDDCDGWTDAEDSDCDSPTPDGGMIDGGWYYGDANTDQCVDGLDLSILASNWGRTDTSWSTGDFNSDGAVGFTDFILLASNWGKCNPNARSLMSVDTSVRALNETTQFVANVLFSLAEFYQGKKRIGVAARDITQAVSSFERSSEANASKCKYVKRVLNRSVKKLKRKRGRKVPTRTQFRAQWSRFGEALLQASK